MRISLTATLLPIFLIFFTNGSQAQKIILKESTYFSSGKYDLPTNATARLNKLIAQYKNTNQIVIRIEGNTDNIGGHNSNRILSEKRAASIKDYLIKGGIPEAIISTLAFGPDNPVSTNTTSAGRKMNRRVDILILENAAIDAGVPNISTVQHISELYRQIQTPLQVFCINPDKDTVIRCKQGTVIYIKANSLIPQSNSRSNCVTFKVKEDLLNSDMLLDNLSTTSNGQLIETQGMIYTEAVDDNGNRLELKKGKDLVIVLPIDTVNSQALIFDGNRAHDSVMNWTVNNNSVLSNFTLSDIDVCGIWVCGGIVEKVDCEPCPFFFCRMGRIGKSFAGIFSRSQRSRNIQFRNCQEKLKDIEDSTLEIISRDPLTVSKKPPIDSSLRPKCQQLEALFKKYGVNNTQALMLAINKPLLDSFGVSTIQQLQDTLRKLNKQKIELEYRNRSLSFEDFKYYVFNTPNLGWSNIDVFTKYPAERLITLRVNLAPGNNVDCKLVFRNRRIIMPPSRLANRFEFNSVPVNERATIVAIKYLDGRPLLAMKDIALTESPVDLEFKELSIEELKEKLKILD